MATNSLEITTSIELALSSVPTGKEPTFGHAMLSYFQFAPAWTNLNHGSFGASPTAITKAHHHFQLLSEQHPDPFIRTRYPRLLSSSRHALATLLNAPADSLVFIPNATTGVNTILRGLPLTRGDSLLYFDFIYGACGNTVLYVSETTGASAIRISVSLPSSDEDILTAFNTVVDGLPTTGGKRIVVFDTIVSVPGIRLPFEKLVAACRAKGVLSLVDAAHGVGHIPLDLTTLDPDFLTSNCHKWLHVPRGCAFLYVAPRNRELIRSTLPTSWGFVPANSAGDGISSSPLPVVDGDDGWARQFTFVGTVDGSSYLCVPAALALRQAWGGEEKIMRYIWGIAKRGAEIFRDAFGTEVMDEHQEEVGMFNIRLPLTREEVGEGRSEEVVGFVADALVGLGTYLVVFEYRGSLWCRVSGQVYLEEEDFVKGARAVMEVVGRVKRGEW